MMGIALSWVVVLVRIALSVGLVVVIATNAKRIGKAAWLVASVAAVHVIMQTLYGAVNQFPAIGWGAHVHEAFMMIDICLTSITSLMVVVGFALLRSSPAHRT